MSDLSIAAAASNAPVLFEPGQFVTVKRTKRRAMIARHELEVGTVVYTVAYPDGSEEPGFLAKQLEPVD